MKYFVYFLQSQKDKKFYIGFTTSLSKRLDYHNRGANRSTKFRRPFKMVYYEEFNEAHQARQREYFLKTPKGFLEKRNIIQKLINSGVAQR